MLRFAQAVLDSVDWLVLGYHAAVHGLHIVLVSLATVQLARRLRRRSPAAPDELLTDPLTPGVSILLPTHNAAEAVVDRAHALLAQRYPDLELIIVDDGSTDDTFARLAEAFDLAEVPHPLADEVALGREVTGVHTARTDVPLTVIRTRNAGRVAEALDAGLRLAGRPLVCLVDTDALLDDDALLRMVAPFVDDPRRVVAASGTVRPRNGSHTHRGRVTRAMMPSRMLARIQVVEHLRASAMARVGWAPWALPLTAGAVGIYRRDLLLDIGGLGAGAGGHAVELALRVHRHLCQRNRGERIAVVAEPVCWTQVPEARSAVRRQRSAWSLGLAEALVVHRDAIANPRYGRFGMTLAYVLLFELLGPLVEVAGIVAIGLGLAFGPIGPPFAVLYLLVAVVCPLIVSLASLALDELAFAGHRRWGDLGWLLVAAAAEQLGFRQAHAWWRLRGVARSVSRSGASRDRPGRLGVAGDWRREPTTAG